MKLKEAKKILKNLSKPTTKSLPNYVVEEACCVVLKELKQCNKVIRANPILKPPYAAVADEMHDHPIKKAMEDLTEDISKHPIEGKPKVDFSILTDTDWYIGQEVYSILYGPSKVTSINEYHLYPVKVGDESYNLLGCNDVNQYRTLYPYPIEVVKKQT